MRLQPRIDSTVLWSALLLIGLGTPPNLSAQQTSPKAKPAEETAVEKDKPEHAPSEPAHDADVKPPRPGGLRMSRAVICTTIDGFEDYKPLVGAAQTSEEKLLVYYRPLRYTVEENDDLYRAHLIQDNVLRRRGKKEVLRQKKKVVDYEPKSKTPLGPIYIKSTISLKGLTPGEYELTIILHDVLDPSAPPSTQVVPFKVIPPFDPRTKEAAPGKTRTPKPARSEESGSAGD